MLRNLDESLSTAENLRTWCATTLGMNTFQPIAASAVEVCHAAANLFGNQRAEKLAVYAVDETEKAINRMAVLSQSPEIVQQLLLFETNLDGIRRFIEHMPSRSRNKAKLLVEHIFDREARRLKTELKRTLNTLLEESAKSLGYSDISRRDSIFELASLTARAAGVICDAPVLNFLKPIVGIAVIICDTAKTVKSNREAALELAKHSSVVTKSIVDHAASLDHSAANNGEALMALKSALEDIQLYLAALQNPRRRLTS